MRYQRTHAERSLDNTIRDLRRARRKRERETMTAEEVEARMRKIVRERLERDGDQAEVSIEDFYRDNLPMEKVKPIVARVIAAVAAEMGRA